MLKSEDLNNTDLYGFKLVLIPGMIRTHVDAVVEEDCKKNMTSRVSKYLMQL